MPLFLHDTSQPLWVSLVLVVVGVLFIGIGKAGFGGGVGLVTPPLLAMVMPVKLLLPLMLPLLMACDVVALWIYWKEWDSRNVWRLFPGTAVGVALGTGLLTTLPERELRAGLGVLAVTFVALQVVRGKTGGKVNTYSPRTWHAWLVGSVGGFCSVIAHAGGPVITLFLLPQGFGKKRFVGTTVLYYTLLNWIKVPSYVLTGILDRHVLAASLWLVPAIPVGAYMGVKLNRLCPERWFNPIVYTVVVVTGVKLLVG